MTLVCRESSEKLCTPHQFRELPKLEASESRFAEAIQHARDAFNPLREILSAMELLDGGGLPARDTPDKVAVSNNATQTCTIEPKPEASALRTKVSLAKAGLDLEQHKMSLEKRKMDRKLESLNTKIVELESKKRQMSDENVETKQKLESLNTKIVELESEKRQMSHEKVEMKQKLESLSTRIVELGADAEQKDRIPNFPPRLKSGFELGKSRYRLCPT
ncbi:hypothetical protein BSKO_02567 [Bryopsis sp. KO-2023]|nr:hypothetical protein BSKO_02567 [Bryopsis sp. KO-2023]